MIKYTTTIDEANEFDERSTRGAEAKSNALPTADAAGSNFVGLPQSNATMPRGRGGNLKQSQNEDDWQNFRRNALALYANAKTLKASTCEGVDPNDRADLIVQIEQSLDTLMTVRFGKKECLARCVVAIQSVLLRADWRQSHVDFIEDVSGFLKSRSSLEDSTVDAIYQSIEQHQLDPFRAILSR